MHVGALVIGKVTDTRPKALVDIGHRFGILIDFFNFYHLRWIKRELRRCSEAVRLDNWSLKKCMMSVVRCPLSAADGIFIFPRKIRFVFDGFHFHLSISPIKINDVIQLCCRRRATKTNKNTGSSFPIRIPNVFVVDAVGSRE